MIQIKLNANEMLIDIMTLQELLNSKGFQSGMFAVALNRQFIPRSEYASTTVNDGDEIDIVTPMQGG